MCKSGYPAAKCPIIRTPIIMCFLMGREVSNRGESWSHWTLFYYYQTQLTSISDGFIYWSLGLDRISYSFRGVSCGPTTDRSHNVGQNSKFLSSSFDASPSLLRFPYTSLLFLSAVKLSCGAELNYTNIAGRFHSHSLYFFIREGINNKLKSLDGFFPSRR